MRQKTSWQPRKPTPTQQALAQLQRQANENRWEKLLEQHLLAIPGAEGFTTQVKFHPTRRWRFDYADKNLGVAVECEGGVWSDGKTGHTSGTGYRNNCVKYNHAALLGWLVLRFTSDQIKRGEDIAFIEQAIQIRQKAITR